MRISDEAIYQYLYVLPKGTLKTLNYETPLREFRNSELYDSISPKAPTFVQLRGERSSGRSGN